MRLIKRNFLITICVATLCGGTNCFASGGAVAATAATAIPLNSHLTRVRMADGSERVFARTPESPELLIGPEPWKAIERPENRMLNVIRGDVTDPKHEEYCFVGGRLRFMSKDGKDTEVAAEPWGRGVPTASKRNNSSAFDAERTPRPQGDRRGETPRLQGDRRGETPRLQGDRRGETPRLQGDRRGETPRPHSPSDLAHVPEATALRGRGVPTASKRNNSSAFDAERTPRLQGDRRGETPRLQGDIAALWPTKASRRADMLKNPMWRDGEYRLRLFSRNPNRTALVLAQLALIFSGLLLFRRKRILIGLGCVFAVVGGVLVVMTQSRGGLLAFAAGMAAMGFFWFRSQLQNAHSPWTRLSQTRRIRTDSSDLTRLGQSRLRVLLLVGVLAAAAAFLGGATYYMCASKQAVHQGLHDKSSSHRLYIWREVPRMIAAAPMGWGLWQSGPAYNSWFEKPDRMHSIGDLFNDHLSRFVEGGFVFGGVYLFLWVFAFVVSWRHARRGGSPVPLALFASYFVASSFNPMNYWGPSFYVTGGCLLAAALWRCRLNFGKVTKLRMARSPRCAPASGAPCGDTGDFPLLRVRARAEQIRLRTEQLMIVPRFGTLPKTCAPVLSLSLAITLVLLAVIAVVALCAGSQDVPLRVSTLGRRVVVGRGEPKVWVADDGFVLCGDYNGFPGRELRDFYRQHPKAEPIGLVESLSALPKSVERLILTGKLCEEFLEHPDRIAAKQVLIYSPPFASRKIKPALRKKYDVEFLTGEFAARLTGDDRTRKKWVHVVPGAELYVPHWLDLVVRKGE